MAAEPIDSGLLNLETLRLQLEKNVTELRGLLRQWQTWEAEYEAIKEELSSLEGKPTRKQLVSATTIIHDPVH